MTVVLGILLAFFVFFIVVMIHEFGHFSTARMTGMRVLEFGLGIPPKIKKIFTDKHGTEFTINALPIGGFVRIDGEDVRSPDAFKDGAFMSKSWPKRVLVLIAGVCMNWLLAWCIFFGLFLAHTKPLAVIPLDVWATNSYFLPSFQEAMNSGYATHSGIILTPLTGSIAANSWIMPGDKVNSINGQKVNSIESLMQLISTNANIVLDLQRNNEHISVNVHPENGKIGTYIAYDHPQINQNYFIAPRFAEALTLATKETYHTSVLTFNLVKKTFTSLLFPKSSEERGEAQKQLSGPIGAGNAFVVMVQNSVPLSTILLFVALLSINLAVMNILPFPALDGGRVLSTTLYSISTKLWIPKQKFLVFEWWINTIGFLILLGFMLYVSGLDIMRFF